MFQNQSASNISNPLSRAVAGLNSVGGRLAAAASQSLEYHTASGSWIEVNGELVDISTALTNDIGIDSVMDVDGADTDFPPTASTLYYAYVSNSKAAAFPLSLRLSTSAPDVAVSGVWAGMPYLGAPGIADNAANWRYVGTVYLDSSIHVLDTPTARNVANYYNRLPRSIVVRPQYADANSQTTFAFNSATFAIVAADALATFVTPQGFNTSTRAFSTLIGSAAFAFSARGAAAGAYGVSVDSATTPSFATPIAALAVNSLAVPIAWTDALGGEGLHTVRLLGMSGGVGDTLIADLARTGSASDPSATSFNGWVLS